MGLAENRSKDKWSKDPRGTKWANDESGFGYRMLQSMGWSKGTGLGAKQSGAKTHVKVKMKSNFLGVGASEDNDYNWLKTQDDFADVLSSLAYASSTPDASGNKPPPPPKSQQRKRLLYARFKKSKDMSKYTSDDLKSIIGSDEHKLERKLINSDLYGSDATSASTPTSLTPATPSPTEQHSLVASSCDSDEERDDNTGVTTVTKSVSVSDYFQKKLAKRGKTSMFTPTSAESNRKGKRRNERHDGGNDDGADDGSTKRKRSKLAGKSKEQEAATQSGSDGDSKKKRKQKKKKKDKRQETGERQSGATLARDTDRDSASIATETASCRDDDADKAVPLPATDAKKAKKAKKKTREQQEQREDRAKKEKKSKKKKSRKKEGKAKSVVSS